MNIHISISELTSIIDSQWENGMLPHIRFVKGETGYSPDSNEWEAYHMSVKDIYETSGITQPPVLAIALNKIIQHQDFTFEYIKSIEYILKGLERFHDFLLSDRDPEQEYLSTIIHPWESGLDNSPCFDIPNLNAKLKLTELNIKQQIKDRKDLNKVIEDFRPGDKDYDVYGKLIGFYKLYNYNQSSLAQESPFKVQDLLFNVLLFKSIQMTKNIYAYLYSHTKNKIYFDLQIKNTHTAILLEKSIKNKLFNKITNKYYSYDSTTNSKINCNTIQSLFASIIFEKDKVKIKRLIEEYQSYPSLSFLSTSNYSKSFNPIKYWRGPIWPIMNWLIIDHVKSIDIDLAKKYSQTTLHLISEGFNYKSTNINAMQLMYFNLVFNTFTTPSKNQYKHGWLWDSAFASIGWLHVNQKFENNIYSTIYQYKNDLIKKETNLYEIRQILKSKFNIPLFDEYYIGVETDKYKLGEPIGSEMMTWTAAVYLDLYNFLYNTDQV